MQFGIETRWRVIIGENGGVKMPVAILSIRNDA
jgi:hypothetical protein